MQPASSNALLRSLSPGRDSKRQLGRLAASNADRAGRDIVRGWMRQAALDVAVDRIGNLIGLWHPERELEAGP